MPTWCLLRAVAVCVLGWVLSGVIGAVIGLFFAVPS